MAHKEEIKEYDKEYRETHKEEIAKYQKEYYQTHREEKLEKDKEYRQTHKEEIAEQKKEYYQTHKGKFSEGHKKYYQTHKEKFSERHKKYNQIHKEERKLYMRERRKTSEGIYDDIKSSAKQRHIEFLISKKEFVNWWNSQEQKCFYCGITLEELSKIKDIINNGINRLTIDRLDNAKGYTIDNIVLACKRCNQMKSNFFTVDEMRQIAQLFIRPKWEEQLKKIKPLSSIESITIDNEDEDDE